jgi:hypothetical protein
MNQRIWQVVQGCAQAEQRTVNVFVAVEVDDIGDEDKEDPSASQRVDQGERYQIRSLFSYHAVS